MTRCLHVVLSNKGPNEMPQAIYKPAATDVKMSGFACTLSDLRASWFTKNIVWQYRPIEYSIPQLRMMIKEIEGILGRKISDNEWNSL